MLFFLGCFLFCLFIKGRSPNYQVCKLDQGVIDVTLQSDPIAYELFVKKSVSTVEGIPQWTNEKLTPDKHISKESQSDTDTSYDKPPLCLFLYGGDITSILHHCNWILLQKVNTRIVGRDNLKTSI
ncbi:hypothetical protein Hdeb2414_s0008g00275591 [Helianthus debilis subsp. tardiflorus]